MVIIIPMFKNFYDISKSSFTAFDQDETCLVYSKSTLKVNRK